MDDNVKFHLPVPAHFNLLDQNQPIDNARKSVRAPAAEGADHQLRAACDEMESLFVNYLLKEMRATIDKSGFISGGRAEEIFTSMLDVELSRKISTTRGIGLSAILMEQLGSKKGGQTGSE